MCFLMTERLHAEAFLRFKFLGWKTTLFSKRVSFLTMFCNINNSSSSRYSLPSKFVWSLILGVIHHCIHYKILPLKKLTIYDFRTELDPDRRQGVSVNYADLTSGFSLQNPERVLLTSDWEINHPQGGGGGGVVEVKTTTVMHYKWKLLILSIMLVEEKIM